MDVYIIVSGFINLEFREKRSFSLKLKAESSIETGPSVKENLSDLKRPNVIRRTSTSDLLYIHFMMFLNLEALNELLLLSGFGL
jgi:hypothetical protein